MSTLYVLNEDDRKIPKEDIGGKMHWFLKELYESTGLSLNIVAYTHEQAIEALFKSGIFLEKYYLKK